MYVCIDVCINHEDVNNFCHFRLAFRFSHPLEILNMILFILLLY